MTIDQLLERIERNKPLDFGDIFGKSIELFKKVWVQGMVHFLILMACVIPVVIAIYVFLFAFIGISESGGFDEYGNYNSPSDGLVVGAMIVFIVVVFILSFVLSAVQFGIFAHFFRICKQVDLGEKEETSYFMFLKREYMGKVFTLAMAKFGITILAALLCYLPVFYVLVPLHLMVVIFAFNPNLTVSEIIKASFALGNKKWLLSFGLIWVASMLAMVIGYIMCGIGMLATVSFTLLPVYFIYKETIGFEDDELENKETLFIN